ncbi:hypothetical protein [Roseibium sp. RKSG952]|uniref:hypothetical protein n=1 Tax=Roseibium sp. RKSG952 TaxID=2529384 RepID=UPI0012BC16C6|nr:hypothetical protein [Roseibium sp. RKSG952]MTH94804.1 hypothetical protein [Roseibium sp. RKSG952]
MRKANGLLFIGDPHVSSRKPGRRRDEKYASTILSKVEYAISVANERKLIPIFLGDMHDSAVETDEGVKTRLIRILCDAWTKPISNVGNHDIRNTTLTTGDTLKMYAEAGVLVVADKSGPVETVMIGDKVVGIGATPYGQSWPTDARPLFGEVDTIIWLTHHDIAFENPYPGSIAPTSIAGCRLVVNGHIHLHKNPVRVLKTLWMNPGNITRQTVDTMDHDPAVWELTADSKFNKIRIPHEKGVFDLTGKLVDPIAQEQVSEQATETLAESEFVNLLSADSPMEMNKSDDGSILKEEIEEKFERENTPHDVRTLILHLHAEATSLND